MPETYVLPPKWREDEDLGQDSFPSQSLTPDFESPIGRQHFSLPVAFLLHPLQQGIARTGPLALHYRGIRCQVYSRWGWLSSGQAGQ